MASYRLHDPFQVEGQWWLPSNQEHPVDGTLHYACNSIVLKLRGGLTGQRAAMTGEVGSDFPNRFEAVHGRTDDHEEITLLHTHVSGQTTDFAGNVRKSEITAPYAIIGAHTDAFSELKIESSMTGFTHLDGFLMSGLLNLQEEGEGEEFKGVTVSYKQPQPVSFRIDAIESALEFDAELSMRPSRMSIELNTKVFARVRPDQPKPLGWHLVRIERTAQLLTLLSDEVMRPVWHRIKLEGDEYEHWLLQRDDQHANAATEIILLLHLPHIIANFPQILDKWLTAPETLGSAIELWDDARRGPHSSQDGRFLMLAQSVEAFCRATVPSTDPRPSFASRLISLLDSLSLDAVVCLPVQVRLRVGGRGHKKLPDALRRRSEVKGTAWCQSCLGN